MELKRFEVLSLIRQIFPQLDSRLSYPTVSQSDQARTDEKTPILTYSVNGPFAAFEIKKDRRGYYQAGFDPFRGSGGSVGTGSHRPAIVHHFLTSKSYKHTA